MNHRRIAIRIFASLLILGCLANLLADITLTIDQAAFQSSDNGQLFLTEGTAPGSGILYLREYSEESESNFKQNFENFLDKHFSSSENWNTVAPSEHLSDSESLRLAGYGSKSPDFVILLRKIQI